jgi:hypothetical protein
MTTVLLYAITLEMSRTNYRNLNWSKVMDTYGAILPEIPLLSLKERYKNLKKSRNLGKGLKSLDPQLTLLEEIQRYEELKRLKPGDETKDSPDAEAKMKLINATISLSLRLEEDLAQIRENMARVEEDSQNFSSSESQSNSNKSTLDHVFVSEFLSELIKSNMLSPLDRSYTELDEVLKIVNQTCQKAVEMQQIFGKIEKIKKACESSILAPYYSFIIALYPQVGSSNQIFNLLKL